MSGLIHQVSLHSTPSATLNSDTHWLVSTRKESSSGKNKRKQTGLRVGGRRSCVYDMPLHTMFRLPAILFAPASNACPPHSQQQVVISILYTTLHDEWGLTQLQEGLLAGVVFGGAPP